MHIRPQVFFIVSKIGSLVKSTEYFEALAWIRHLISCESLETLCGQYFVRCSTVRVTIMNKISDYVAHVYACRRGDGRRC